MLAYTVSIWSSPVTQGGSIEFVHPSTGVFLTAGFEQFFSGLKAVGFVEGAGAAVAAVDAEEDEGCDYEEDGGEDGDGDYDACAQFLDEVVLGIIGVRRGGRGGRSGVESADGNYMPWRGWIGEDSLGDGEILVFVVGYYVGFLKEGAAEGVLGIVLGAANGKVVCGLVCVVCGVVEITLAEIEGAVWEGNGYCRAETTVVAELESHRGIEDGELFMNSVIDKVKLGDVVINKSESARKLITREWRQPYMRDCRIDQGENAGLKQRHITLGSIRCGD